jgi:hypothetical protein
MTMKPNEAIRSFVQQRPVAVATAVLGALLLGATAVVGISDNLPGALLCYGGITCVVLACVMHWRRPRSFFLLLGWSFLGFFVSAILHNLLYGLGQALPGLPAWVLWLIEAGHVAFFLVAVLLCPPGILVGLIGFLIAGIWQWSQRRQMA